MVIVCMECGKPAKHIRFTELEGSQPYCEDHAKLQSDFGKFGLFGKSESYIFWSEVIGVEHDKSE
jgi:hypothetical protein